MNIEVFGRLRPAVADDRRSESLVSGDITLEADGSQRLINKLGGSFFTFQQLFNPTASNYDVFHSTIQHLLPQFLDGCNVSFIVAGTKGSGKDYTVAGNTSSNTGLFNILIQRLFTMITSDGVSESMSRASPRLSFTAYDINGDDIFDLLGSGSRQLEVKDTAEDGTVIPKLTAKQLNSISEGKALFDQAWSSHVPTNCAVIQLELNSVVQRTEIKVRSFFTFVILPLSISPDLTRDSDAPVGTMIKRTALSISSQTYIHLSQLIATLANRPFADRVINYSGCTLTQLLQDPLGGNSRTQVLMCFAPSEDPHSASAMFNLARDFLKVKNFPIKNDDAVQLLLTQYRARILSLQQPINSAAAGLTKSHDPSLNNEVKAENVILRDENERLKGKLDDLQRRFSKLTLSETDLSSQLLKAQEDYLKLSKIKVEMLIENNKMKEEFEAEKFELKSKIMQLELAYNEAEEDKKRLAQMATSDKEKLEDAENRWKDLADELKRLQANNATLNAAYEKQMERNDQMRVEMLKIINSQLSTMGQSETAARDKDRIRAVVDNLAESTADLPRLDETRTSLDKPLFEAINQLRRRLEQERVEFEEERLKMQNKISELRTEVNEARRLTRETQSQLSVANAQLITANSDRTSLQSQVNRLQHKMKNIINDCKSEINKHIHDMSVYLDAKERRTTDGTSTPARMEQYFDQLLKDLKRAHRFREDQLSSAAVSCKQRLQEAVRQHEMLIVAYSDLRQQVLSRGLSDVELGPDIHKLILQDESEFKSNQQRQIEKLQNELIKKQAELDAVNLRMKIDNANKNTGDEFASHDTNDLSEVRKQMLEFTQETQRTMEQERARLLSDNTMLKQEVSVLQEYIDAHLGRYRDEIVRLRQVIGQFKLTASLMDPDQRVRVSFDRHPSPVVNMNLSSRRQTYRQ